ncbi:MAG: hypothetical protein CL757_01815 [Chloroflexi bacterium]|nr:hypothetical protein [Chloroflexota bacterium]
MNWLTKLRKLMGIKLSLTLICVGLVVGACTPANPPMQEINGISMIVATTSDVTVGQNRIGFSLFNFEGEAIVAKEVTVEAIFYPPNEQEGIIKDSAPAYWMSIPGGAGKGLYITNLQFDVSGSGTQQNPNYWELVASFTYEEENLWSKAAIVVADESPVVAIGNEVPKSLTLTGDTLAELERISTDINPDPDLYQVSIDEAVINGKPTVIVFATPALCVSQVCGPIVDMVSNIKMKYEKRLDFIHVEVFENPKALLSQGRFSGQQVEAVKEWGLVTEPWVFVVDRNGLLSAKFEIFATEAEIISAIEAVVN